MEPTSNEGWKSGRVVGKLLKSDKLDAWTRVKAQECDNVKQKDDE